MGIIKALHTRPLNFLMILGLRSTTLLFWQLSYTAPSLFTSCLVLIFCQILKTFRLSLLPVLESKIILHIWLHI